MKELSGTILTKYLILVSFIIHVEATLRHDLIRDFFKSKHLRHGILIFCEEENDADVVIVIRQLSEENIHVVATFAENKALQEKLFREENIERSRIGIVASAKCMNNVSIALRETMLENRFKSTEFWLIINEELSKDDANDIFHNSYLNMDSEVTLAQITSLGYDLKEVYHNGREGKLMVESLGAWNGGRDESRKPKYDRRIDLGGVALKAIFVVVKKITRNVPDYLVDNSDVVSDAMSKNNYALLLLLSDIFNFTMIVSRTLSWGYPTNGSYDGQLGALQRGEADITGAPVYLKQERLDVGTPFAETGFIRVSILFRDPKPGGAITALLAPVEPGGWLGAAGCLLLGALTLTACTRMQRGSRAPPVTGPAETAFFTLGAICQQGVPEMISRTSGRLSIISIFAFSLLFYQFYSASIVSSLLRELPRSIKTLEDYLKSDMQLASEDMAYHRVYFTVSPTKTVKALYEKKLLKQPNGGFLPTETGVAMVKEGGCGFLLDVHNGYSLVRNTFSMQQLCELRELHLDASKNLVTMLRKNSPYTEMFAFGFRKLYERGLVHKEATRWHAPRPRCVQELAEYTFSAPLKELSCAFLILGAGMLISMIILAVELTYRRMRYDRPINVLKNWQGTPIWQYQN